MTTLRLPDALASQHVTLRREVEADVPFLEQLYFSVRWDELAPTAWTGDVKAAFLSQQFALQRHHYRTHYRTTDFAIVVHDDQPIGRLYLDRGRTEYRIVDISLVPAARGAGVGTSLLGAVIAEATGAGVPVTIHVEKQNPAQRLYRRLGFRVISESGPYDFMRRESSDTHTARDFQEPRRAPDQVYTA